MPEGRIGLPLNCWSTWGLVHRWHHLLLLRNILHQGRCTIMLRKLVEACLAELRSIGWRLLCILHRCYRRRRDPLSWLVSWWGWRGNTSSHVSLHGRRRWNHSSSMVKSSSHRRRSSPRRSSPHRRRSPPHESVSSWEKSSTRRWAKSISLTPWRRGRRSPTPSHHIRWPPTIVETSLSIVEPKSLLKPSPLRTIWHSSSEVLIGRGSTRRPIVVVHIYTNKGGTNSNIRVDVLKMGIEMARTKKNRHKINDG